MMYYIISRTSPDPLEMMSMVDYYLFKSVDIYGWTLNNLRACRFSTRLIARIFVVRRNMKEGTLKICPYGEMDNHISMRS